MKAQLLQAIEKHGYRGRIVSVSHLPDLRESIETQHREGCFDQEFYEERLTDFDSKLPEDLPQARSIIVVAVKQPQVELTFTWRGEQIQAIIPPTYSHSVETDQQIEATLSEELAPGGYRVARALLPKKLVAVGSGLAAYGRNNIAYVEGMGSFHRVATFYSDLSCEEEEWREARMMDRCEECRACLKHCPSEAIRAERFLVYAEHCIVYHNEKPGDVSFPAWIDPCWHNCLVGCMHCQRVCPENKDYVGWIDEGPTFSQEETALIVKGAPVDQLPSGMVEKLEEADLVVCFDILPRNLSALLHHRGGTRCTESCRETLG